MAGLPRSIVIALWVTGSCWAVVLAAHVAGFTIANGTVFALVVFGVAAGIVEYVLRRGRGR